MADRFCTSCGHALIPEDRLCASCGRAVTQPAQGSSIPAAQQTPRPAASAGQQRAPQPVGGPWRAPGAGLAAAIVAAVLFVVVVVPLALAFPQGGSVVATLGLLVCLVVFVRMAFGPTSTAGKPLVRTPARHIPQWVKIAVATRDGGKCRRCGSAYELQYDHIIPYSRGGRSDDVNNIQLLCGRCNRVKSNRYVG